MSNYIKPEEFWFKYKAGAIPRKSIESYKKATRVDVLSDVFRLRHVGVILYYTMSIFGVVALYLIVQAYSTPQHKEVYYGLCILLLSIGYISLSEGFRYRSRLVERFQMGFGEDLDTLYEMLDHPRAGFKDDIVRWYSNKENGFGMFWGTVLYGIGAMLFIKDITPEDVDGDITLREAKDNIVNFIVIFFDDSYATLSTSYYLDKKLSRYITTGHMFGLLEDRHNKAYFKKVVKELRKSRSQKKGPKGQHVSS